MKVKINKKYNFKEIRPEEGMVLTDWEKGDIMNYSSSTLMYCPMSFDEKSLYEITEAEDKEYKAQQEEAYKREEEERERLAEEEAKKMEKE